MTPARTEQLSFPWPQRFTFGLGRPPVQIQLPFSWAPDLPYKIQNQTELTP